MITIYDKSTIINKRKKSKIIIQSGMINSYEKINNNNNRKYNFTVALVTSPLMYVNDRQFTSNVRLTPKLS